MKKINKVTTDYLDIALRHSYSLTYTKKEVNELTKKLNLAQALWA